MKFIGSFRSEIKERPIQMALVCLLLALSGMFVPTKKLGELIGDFYAMSIVRFLFGGLGIALMLLFGFTSFLKPKKDALKHIDVFFVAMLIAVNNFPLIPLFRGDVTVTAGANKIFSYVLFCLSVGFFEEIFFRGLILPILEIIFKKFKAGDFFAIAVSSVVFGLVHLVNLFSGSGAGAVFLQVGYSALIGAMCAVVFFFTRSVFLPILLHTVYDIGGLMTGEGSIASGIIWTTETVILTVVVSIAAAAYLTVRFIFELKKRIRQSPGNPPEPSSNQPPDQTPD